MDVTDLMNRISDNLVVGRAFGQPYQQGDTLIIPVAWVAGGGGGGSGDVRSGEESGRSDPGDGNGRHVAPHGQRQSGSGGGFGGVVWPLGVYVVREGTVRWVPSLDVTRVVLASLALARTVVRPRRRARSQ
jgi:uncharacterized spore protein YtfJ